MKIKLYKTVDLERLPRELRHSLRGVLRELTGIAASIHNLQQAPELFLDPKGLLSVSAEIDRVRKCLYDVDSSLNGWHEVAGELHNVLEKAKEEIMEKETSDGD